MKTVALRFADNFAPYEGTISAHSSIINDLGYVWYGKLGAGLSKTTIDSILHNNNPKILLVHSGKADRYWAYVESIQREVPEKTHIPVYYRDYADKFKTWFKVTRIEAAPKDILSKCVVSSSKRPLSEVSKYSMSPFFIVEVEE